jgi:hypothetical protein
VSRPLPRRWLLSETEVSQVDVDRLEGRHDSALCPYLGMALIDEVAQRPRFVELAPSNLLEPGQVRQENCWPQISSCFVYFYVLCRAESGVCNPIATEVRCLMGDHSN